MLSYEKGSDMLWTPQYLHDSTWTPSLCNKDAWLEQISA